MGAAGDTIKEVQQSLLVAWQRAQRGGVSSVRRALSHSSGMKVECKQTIIFQGAAEI